MQRIVVAVGLAVQLVAVPARAQGIQELNKEHAEILSLLAQHELQLPFNQTPMPCFAPWVTDNDNFVRNVAPIGQKAGLQAGDTLKRIGAQTLSGTEPWEWQRAMLRLTRGLSSYYIEVSRAGKSVVLTMPCEAQVASRLFDSELRLLTALTRGNWYACMDSGETIINTFGTAISRTFSRMGSCAQLANEDDNKQGEYFFGEALGLTLEIRALAPQPEEMRKQILELLLRLDYLRVSGGVDHATKLRAAMTNVGLTPPEFNASAFIERVLEAAKTLPKTAATGTGFVVHPSGVIVTANHVIDGASTITAQCGAGTPLDATVRSKSAALDLAVLAVRAPAPLMYLDVARDVADIQLGSSIFTIGFPVTELLGNDAKYTEGTISGLSGVAGDASFFQVSVPIQPGNSGGALVDSRGRVIGVVLSTASAPLFLGLTGSLPQNVNWAVKSPAVRSLFMPPAARPAAGSREAAIKQAVAATCFIRATP